MPQIGDGTDHQGTNLFDVERCNILLSSWRPLQTQYCFLRCLTENSISINVQCRNIPGLPLRSQKMLKHSPRDPCLSEKKLVCSTISYEKWIHKSQPWKDVFSVQAALHTYTFWLTLESVCLGITGTTGGAMAVFAGLKISIRKHLIKVKENRISQTTRQTSSKLKT